VNSVFEYNAFNDTWKTLDAYMHQERAFLTAAIDFDGNIYAIGGAYVDSGGMITRILDSAEVYNPDLGTWTLVAPMPTPRMGLAAATSPDGRIYALGGNNDGYTHLDTAEAYDPATDTWSTLVPMPTARRNLMVASGSIRGISYIYAIGGHGIEFPLKTVERYTP
jgi:N-acetylneuraminic acid mutarotase